MTSSNSGNTTVRNERIRFEFPIGAEILEANVDPSPPKEVGVAAKADANDGIHERTYTLEHLTQGQKISFHFVVSGSFGGDLSLFGYNPEDDVPVVRGAVAVAADDGRVLTKFLFIFLLTLFVPPTLSGIPFFGQIAAGLYYGVTLLLVLPLLPDVARVISEFTLSSLGPQRPAVSIKHVKDSTVYLRGDGLNFGMRAEEGSRTLTPVAAEQDRGQ